MSRDERNPFGLMEEDEPEVVATGAEATKLTEILDGLPLSGLSRDEQGNVRSVLLGDLRLEAGCVVPQLVEGQTDRLVVHTLSSHEIVISWQLEAGRVPAQPRVLRRKIDLSPKIEVILPGQVKASSSNSTPGAGVKETRRATIVLRGRASSLPHSIVPTSGLPPAKP